MDQNCTWKSEYKIDGYFIWIKVVRPSRGSSSAMGWISMNEDIWRMGRWEVATSYGACCKVKIKNIQIAWDKAYTLSWETIVIYDLCYMVFICWNMKNHIWMSCRVVREFRKWISLRFPSIFWLWQPWSYWRSCLSWRSFSYLQ